MKIQQKVQLILPVLLRTIGPILLRSGIGGAGGTGGTSTSSSKDDDDSDDDTSGDSKTRTGSNGRKVSISLPTFPPDEDDESEEDAVSTTTKATTTTKKATTTSEATTTQAPTTAAPADSTETAALVGRVDIRIEDENVGNTSETDKDTDADAIAALFTETPTTTEKDAIIPLSGDSKLNIDINQSSSGSATSNDGKPTATYLPTSNDSNLVRRKKAIQN